ncbi:MAG: TetR family transcriptional regulator [Pseudomonadales bacterium]|nr:TetR family transcriptional regulator [Pseudomonadales bacterium]
MGAPTSNSNKTTTRSRGRPAGRTSADGVIANSEALLKTAEALIRAKGPAVSLQAIAEQAGVTKPTLYREVGDRDALVKALAERLSVRMASSVSQMVAKASDPREGMRNLVAGYLELAATDRNVYLFVTAGGTGDDRVQQSLLLADGAAGQFAEPIAAYRKANGADPDVAIVWSYGLLGAMHFVTLWWLRDSTADINVVIDQITALLWSGMGQVPRAE